MKNRVKRWSGLALAVLLVSGCTSSAEEVVSFESIIAPTGVLTVQTFSGGVFLTRDTTATRVHGTVRVRATGFDNKQAARDALALVKIRESGDERDLVIEAVPPNGRASRFMATLDLFVPAGITVSAFAHEGGLLVDGLFVGTLDTSGGPIELRVTTGDAVIRGADSDVIIDDHHGLLDIRTNHGVVDVQRVVGDVRATTFDAPIIADLWPPDAAEIFLSTTNAPINLSVPLDYGADVLASTTAPGDVFISRRLDWVSTFSDVGYAEGFLFDGRGLIDLRTTFEDIVIERN